MQTLSKTNSPASIPRSELRQALSVLLDNEPVFIAFCSDYFNEIYKRFSGSMDCMQKQTMLLDLANHSTLIASLRHRFGSQVDDCLAAISSASPAPEVAAHTAPAQFSVAELDDRDRRAIGQAILAQLTNILTASTAALEVALPRGRRAHIRISQELLSDSAYTRELAFKFEMLDKLEEQIQFKQKLKEQPQFMMFDFEPELRARREQIAEQNGQLKELLSDIIEQCSMASPAS